MDSFFKQPTMFPGFGGSTRTVITPLTEQQAREAAASMPPLRVRPRDNSTGNYATKQQIDPRTGARSIVDDPTKPIFVNGPGEGRTVGSSTRSLNNVGGGTNVPNTSAPGARFQFGMGRPDDGRRIDASIPHGADNFGHQFDYNPYQAASDAYAKSERNRPLDPNDPFDPRNAPKMHQNEMPFGGARADGGPVEPGKAYLVGEQGPELIVPPDRGTVIPAPVVKDWSQLTPPPPSMPVHDQTAPQMMTGQVPEVNYADPMPPAPATTEDIRFNGLAARARLDNAKYDEMMFGRPASDFPSTATTTAGATPPPRNATIFDLRPQPATKPPFRSPSEKDALKRQATSLPDYVEQSLRGMTGSQKRAARSEMMFGMGKAAFDEKQRQDAETLSLQKQSQGAQAAWEAAKATRESLGLPPISEEMDKQFWNGNVQKQLAMVSQMGLLTNEHLQQQRNQQTQQQHAADKADDRAWQTQVRADDRTYEEGRDARKAQQQQQAAATWADIPNSNLQINGLGHVVSKAGKGFSMEDAQKLGLQIDSIDSDGKVRWKQPETRTPTTKDLYNGTDFTPKTLQYNPETGQWEPPKIAQPEAAPAAVPPQSARTHNAPPREFKSEAEARAAGLAPGTRITINGRPATYHP